MNQCGFSIRCVLLVWPSVVSVYVVYFYCAICVAQCNFSVLSMFVVDFSAKRAILSVSVVGFSVKRVKTPRFQCKLHFCALFRSPTLKLH